MTQKLIDNNLNVFLNRPVLLKTKNNLYIHVHNISQYNCYPTFILTPHDYDATEFILVKKPDNIFTIQLNLDMKNQNDTFGYNLYSMPTSDLVFGSGNDDLFSHFTLEKYNEFFYFKSVHKYLSHSYNILRFKSFDINDCAFSIENVNYIHNQYPEQNICVIIFGYPNKSLDLHNSVLLNDLSKKYNKENLSVYLYLTKCADTDFNIIGENDKYNLKIDLHDNDENSFISKSISNGFPVKTTLNIYSHKLLELFWNISQSVSLAIREKKFDNYMLLNIDALFNVNLIRKNFDLSKYYCLNNGKFNFYFSVGKFIQSMNYLYDFFIKNKLLYLNLDPEKIVLNYLRSQNVIAGEIHSITNCPFFAQLQTACEDDYFNDISKKYVELSFI